MSYPTYSDLELEIQELEQENRKLKEKLSGVTMVSDDEKQSIEHILELEKENKRLQSALDYANRDREDMHNKIIELGNKRESQRNMNYKLRKENKNLKLILEQMENTCKDYLNDRDTLREENRKLKEELEFYKGQYEHSMGEDRDPEIEELVAGR